jgi:hypothetical protein
MIPVAKSENRNPKSETNPNQNQEANSKQQTPQVLVIAFSA